MNEAAAFKSISGTSSNSIGLRRVTLSVYSTISPLMVLTLIITSFSFSASKPKLPVISSTTAPGTVLADIPNTVTLFGTDTLYSLTSVLNSGESS